MPGVGRPGTVEQPQYVARVTPCRRALRALRLAEPVAQLVSVHRAGHAHVFTVLAPVGPLDGQHDQIYEFPSQVLIVVGGGGQVPEQSLLRAPRLGVLRPLLRIACLPLQEEQREGQPRPCADRPAVIPAPAPQRSRKAPADGLALCPPTGPEPKPGKPALVQPAIHCVGLRTGSGMTLKGGSALSGDRRCEPVGPGRILDPLMVVVAALACRFCHGSDHPVRGTWIFY